MEKCFCCGRENQDLRFGCCWECADVQSVIIDGTDMRDKGLNGSDVPCKNAFEKIQLLREKKYLTF